MVEALFSQQDQFDLSRPWWQQYVADMFRPQLQFLVPGNWTVVSSSMGDIFIGDAGRAVIPVHPLVNVTHRAVARGLTRAAQEAGVSQVAAISVFDFERAPIRTLQSAFPR
jgi:hypothetical protein